MKDYKIQKLENGATIVLKPIKGLKFTTVNVGFKTGASLDVVPGTAHFLEHNLFLGTTSRSRDEIDKANSEICELNASTSLYYTLVRFKRANSELDSAFEFASDVLLNTKFNANEIKKEREVVRNEIAMSRERDKRNIYAYHNTLWSPYMDKPLCPIIGEDIDKVTKKDMENFRNKNYVAKNFVMYAISSLPMAKIVALYKKHIQPKLRVSEDVNNIVYDMTPSKPSKLQVIELDQEKVDVAISINIPFGIFNSQNRFSRLILSYYFNLEQPYNTLRKKGLVYASTAYIAEWAYNSILTIKFSCSKENINKIIDEYAKEMQELYKNGMSEDKFRNLCKQIVIAEDEKERDLSLFEINDTAFTHITRGLVDDLDAKKEAKNTTLQDINKYIGFFNNSKNQLWVTVLGKVSEKDVYTLPQIQKKFFVNIK